MGGMELASWLLPATRGPGIPQLGSVGPARGVQWRDQYLVIPSPVSPSPLVPVLLVSCYYSWSPLLLFLLVPISPREEATSPLARFFEEEVASRRLPPFPIRFRCEKWVATNEFLLFRFPSRMTPGRPREDREGPEQAWGKAEQD